MNKTPFYPRQSHCPVNETDKRFPFNAVLLRQGYNVVCMHTHTHTHTHIYTMEYYSVIKKNEMIPFATTWVDLEIIILSEITQKEKDKYHMISLICGI